MHEIKWDGYRVSAYVAVGVVSIRTSNGHDWTKRFPAIARAAAGLAVRSAVLDGEGVILDDRGRSSFAELQADLGRHWSERAVLYAFDLLFLDGRTAQRDHSGPGANLFRIACEHELVAAALRKRLNSCGQSAAQSPG